MHEKQVKGILSAKNGMNLYRGCSHGCIYCDSRSACYQFDHAFEDIEVKSNALELLELALRKKRKKCMIGTGSMSDPYIPLEMELGHTRRALELILSYGFGVTLITKSDRVLRDLDLLKKINETTKCVVQMTLTTYDDGLCKILEPNVCVTSRRAEVLNILRDNGIPTVVWLSPVLPFMNDTEENLLGILNLCRQAKVFGILCFGMGVTLREGNREYFYQKLDEHFPGMKQQYSAALGSRYEAASPNNRALMPVFYRFCRRHGIVSDSSKIFEFLRTFEEKETARQLNLFESFGGKA